MFRFASISWLWLLVLVPVLVVFLVLAFRSRKKAMARFGRLDLMEKLSRSVSRKRQIFKSVLFVAAAAFLILALSRPQFGTKMRTVKREGQDIVIALDLSLSMLAEDIKPNRLEKAKLEIGSFFNTLEGDRIGLVAFAGQAFIQCPLTLDYGAARLFLDTMDPDLVPVPGTAIGEAIAKSVTCFVEKERKHKVLVLITDGEDHMGDPLDQAKAAAKEGVVIYTVGIGSAQGVPIPMADGQGRQTGFKKDRSGEVVMTRLDEVSLEKIALETGGKYFRASPGEVELRKIMDDISKMEKKTLSSKQYAQYEERFQGFLAAALVLLLLEVIIPERRRIKKEWKGRFE